MNTDESSTSLGDLSFLDLNETKHSFADDIDSCSTVSPLKHVNDKPTRGNVPRFSLKEASEADLQTSFSEDYDDDVEKYWKSDHHRFDWPDRNVQARSPNSWHSLGLPVQDSFLAKGTALCNEYTKYWRHYTVH